MNQQPQFHAPSDLPKQMFIGGQHVEALGGAADRNNRSCHRQGICGLPRRRRQRRRPRRPQLQAGVARRVASDDADQSARILSRTAALIRRDAERLATIETFDSGKPIGESRGDVETAAIYFEYYAGMADKLQGDTIPLGPDYISLTLHEPVGVTVHIIPWNFPLVTTARGVAPAFAAGNTAVVKPPLKRR